MESTIDVLSFLKSIKNKQNCKFTSFGTKDCYPTLTKELLGKCLRFAETKIEVTEDEKKIIYNSKKLLLFYKGNTWIKKLVGNFLLERISEISNKSNIGLYRNDDLSILRIKSGTLFEKRLFK